MTRIALRGLALLILPAIVCAQESIVPALPGAQVAQVLPDAAQQAASAPAPATAESVRRNLQRINERLVRLQSSLPAPGVAPAPNTAASVPPPATTASAAVVLAPSEAPPAPTTAEVEQLEQQLRSVRAQVRADRVADAGLITANTASAMRARIVFPYTDGSIYEVYAAPDRMTAIELAPGEVITTDNGKPKAADTVQWVADTVTTGEGATRQTIVMVKPIISGIETNLLIPTNRHLYSILLRADTQAYMPLVAFNYPFDEVRPGTERSATSAASGDTERATTAVAPEDMNFAYEIHGAKLVWKPLRVFDDGAKTYLQMPPSMKSWEAPALFVMDDGRAPELVNYRVKGDYYIVDRLFQHAQLRVGAKRFVDIIRDEALRS